MISKETIDKVFENVNIEDVIGDFVNLKKAGANYKGLSPFTDEKTPSFVVSPSKQIWKDFSSGKGGTFIGFLMEHAHMTYPEAITYAAKAGYYAGTFTIINNSWCGGGYSASENSVINNGDNVELIVENIGTLKNTVSFVNEP